MHSLNQHASTIPFVFLKTNFDERRAQFSPDGRWVAYQSNESGRSESMRPFRGKLGLRKRPLPIAGNLEMCHIVHMDRVQIIAKLRQHAPELKAAGVVHLFLHGSYARGTAIRDSSDVDVIAEFDPRRRLSLVDMVAIENRLTDLLGVRVDLSPAKTLKEPVRNKAKREAVLAF
jgi:uncharacterized protein